MLHENTKSSRIFVCDREVSSLSMLRNVLNRVGYKEVTGHTNFDMVALAVAEKRADLVIVDITGWEEDAFAAIKQTRNNVPRQEWVPVFTICSNGDADLRKRAFAGSVTEFLAKPFDWSEFVLRVGNMMLVQKYHENLREQNKVLEYRVTARTKSLADRTEELEQALAELRGTQKQVLQQERFRAFGELAGGIAHDFNNVLMCVIGYTELMLNDKKLLGATPMAEKFLRTMNTAGHDASKIVGRLRNFYRPRENADVFAPTDLNKLMQEVVPLTQPKWRNQALNDGRVIDVALELQEKLPTIPINAPEIRETVVNLVFNAVDAMPQGGTITLRTRAEDGFICLGVSDTGTGMSEEVRQRCLEPFFSTKGDKGTGLGLAMVFGIVQRHEGDVQIESELGRGTTFWIRLSTKLVEQGGVSVSDVSIDRSLQILAVDDEELPRDILARFLTEDGHHVESAMDAYEAAQRFDTRPFDLVITDYAMPGINGAQLASSLQKRSPTPVLLITGSCEEVMANGIPAGVDHVVGKPITQQALRAAIAMALENHRISANSQREPGFSELAEPALLQSVP